MHGTSSKRLARQLQSTSALTATLGAFMLLSATATPSPAHAQDTGATCNMIGSACDISNLQPKAKDGTDGGFDEPGNPGYPGNPASDFTVDLEAPRTLGASGVVSPFNMNSIGGSGGQGGNGDCGFACLANNRGGNGGAGGNGGKLNVTLGAAITGTVDQTGLPNQPATSGVTIQSIGGTGGAAGVASYEMGGQGNGTAGTGGNGQDITANLGGTFLSAVGTGAYINSQGGTGGRGRDTGATYSPQGPDGNTGGASGDVNVTVTGSYTGTGYGVFIQSAAGNGGNGGSGYSSVGGQGGNGGTGGQAGTVTATLASGAQAISSDANGAAFYAASIGGVGGTGGGGSAAGTAGAGSDAKSVNATIDGSVFTSGLGNAYGVLVQSLGGTGGNGGHSGSWFNPESGSGSSGGHGDTVTVTGTGTHIDMGTSGIGGDNSAGLLAQSIGGGGGVGPDSSGWFAVGGNGGNGSDGDSVSVSLTNAYVSTNGFNSGGVIAQSIGGGGGKGGDACAGGGLECDGLIVNMTVGGTAGSGGSVKQGADTNAQILGKSLISTLNKHSPGLQIQSIGGGGGDGGSAYGKAYSLFYGAAISVGGNGGSGGNGGTVNAARTENNGPASSIRTFDSDSYGMLGQSIGGGGGNGGASTAKSMVKATEDYPSQSLSMATGGSGGSGGSANSVYLQSSGLVLTTGGGSAGMVSQSIGGGGGNAGDASATSSATGGNLNLAVSLAFGGQGGAGNNGGNAETMNHGLIVTSGESATGMLIQSIGGGGGNGGAGDSNSSTDKDVNQGDGDAEGSPSGNLSFSLGSAGSGGMGGSGANATATNTGAILTLGDSAHGIQAQTIGGGGGNAGGGSASTQGQINIAPQIGGSGGNGGDTYYTGTVTVNNSGTIVTFGADANAILAQSIGGGGGSGGKAGTSSADAKSRGDGGNGNGDSLTSALTAIENNYDNKGGDAIGDYNYLGNATSGAIGTINSLLGNTTSVSAVADDDDPGDDLDDVAESGGESNDDNKAKSISLNIAIGGKGGNGGSGGYINVTNNDDVATLGKMSDAIIAQSIGGGGGKGGAASTAATEDYSGSLAIGGTGGKGGNGGEPTITNTAQVYTMGPLSAALVAQSIGGGGGIGGASVTTAKSSSSSLTDPDGGDEEGGNDNSVSLEVSLGGNGGAGGISEAAIVNNSGAIETRGHDSIGIIAQSIAGGGGILKTLATDLDNAGGSATASSSKDYSLPFKFGGSQGAAGNSGAAHVTTTAAITTKGDNSYGILAQSIAGGGGVALGGKPEGSSQSDFFGSGSRAGSVTGSSNPNDDGIVNVSVQNAITTSGQGAMGVVAQSIGGGGGLAGDTGWTSEYLSMSGGTHMSGNGGAVDITVAQNGSVTTGAQNAPVIWAQSIGGGGGRISNKNGAFVGTAGGTGKGGAITIEVDGKVAATGNYSAGVFAQSNGDATSNAPISVTVGSTGSVTVGTPTNPTNNSAGVAAGAVIYIDHGGTGANDVYNTVTNNGTVYGYAGPANAIAVYSVDGYTRVINNGTMGGDILLQNGTGQGCFTNNGHFGSGDSVKVGACGVSNTGTIDIASAGVIGTTAIVGDYTQTGSGTLNIDADLQGNNADKLEITGKATIAGSVSVNPTSISNKAVTVLTATDGVSMDPQLKQTDNSALFDFPVVASANALTIQPTARFNDAAQNLGKSKQAVAGNLQHLFESGASMDEGFTALSKVQGGDVAKGFNTLAGQALGAMGAFRYSSSRAFVGNLYGGCDPTGNTNTSNCVWARGYANWTQQDETANSLGYHADAKALQMGAQRQLSPNWSVSGAVAYESTKFRDDEHSAKIKGDSVMAGASVQYTNGPLEVSGAIDAGYGWYDSKRTVAVGSASDVAKASPKEWAVGLHSQASYTLELGKAYLKPSVDLHAIRVHAGSFAETGTSPFNLAVEKQNDTWLSGGVGLEFGGKIALGGGTVLKPYVGGAIEVSNNNDWQTTARFASQPGSDPFTTLTAVPGTLKRITVGADILGSKNLDFSVQYSPEFGDHYKAQTAVAHLTYRF